MTADLAKMSDTVLEAIRTAMASTTDPELLIEARARIAAAKAWAKAHNRLKEFRLELLRLEVDALIHIWQLGGADLLQPGDRATAQFLAELDVKSLNRILSQYQSITTAGGLRRAWLAEQDSAAISKRAELWARRPHWESSDDEPSLGHRLSSLLDDLTIDGTPFSVVDMADRLLGGSVDDYDPAFRDGVMRVCREAVRRATPFNIDGVAIPKFITVRIPVADAEDIDTAQDYVRVPTWGATLDHLQEHIAIREAQILEDRQAVDRLLQTFHKLSAVSESDEDRIGALIARLLSAGGEAAA